MTTLPEKVVYFTETGGDFLALDPELAEFTRRVDKCGWSWYDASTIPMPKFPKQNIRVVHTTNAELAKIREAERLANEAKTEEERAQAERDKQARHAAENRIIREYEEQTPEIAEYYRLTEIEKQMEKDREGRKQRESIAEEHRDGNADGNADDNTVGRTSCEGYDSDTQAAISVVEKSEPMYDLQAIQKDMFFDILQMEHTTRTIQFLADYAFARLQSYPNDVIESLADSIWQILNKNKLVYDPDAVQLVPVQEVQVPVYVQVPVHVPVQVPVQVPVPVQGPVQHVPVYIHGPVQQVPVYVHPTGEPAQEHQEAQGYCDERREEYHNGYDERREEYHNDYDERREEYHNRYDERREEYHNGYDERREEYHNDCDERREEYHNRYDERREEYHNGYDERREEYHNGYDERRDYREENYQRYEEAVYYNNCRQNERHAIWPPLPNYPPPPQYVDQRPISILGHPPAYYQYPEIPQHENRRKRNTAKPRQRQRLREHQRRHDAYINAQTARNAQALPVNTAVEPVVVEPVVEPIVEAVEVVEPVVVEPVVEPIVQVVEPVVLEPVVEPIVVEAVVEPIVEPLVQESLINNAHPLTDTQYNELIVRTMNSSVQEILRQTNADNDGWIQVRPRNTFAQPIPQVTPVKKKSRKEKRKLVTIQETVEEVATVEPVAEAEAVAEEPVRKELVEHVDKEHPSIDYDDDELGLPVVYIILGMVLSTVSIGLLMYM